MQSTGNNQKLIRLVKFNLGLLSRKATDNKPAKATSVKKKWPGPTEHAGEGKLGR